ncbi:tubulin epsilon and delta complex protein 2 [Brachionichthys hirsutus]|uniref:tubulin epsilon and delta complex protein 2 n=1 Tax=Brachionichthys hirsutus TaxID=412623 RepID=UPI0036046AE4
MSLLDAVEQAIKSCKTEQTRINGRIQLYREMLRAVTSHDLEESESADDTATGTDTSPGEKEDLELLERALEKALHVRTGQRPSKTDPNKQPAPPKEPGTSKDRIQASASKGKQNTSRLTSKSVRIDRKGHKKGAGASATSAPGSKSVIRNPGQHETPVHRDILTKDPASSARKSQQSGEVLAPDSTQTAKWKSLMTKQNGLWDKVAATQRNPVPERSHFVERIRATFPEDWPCGSPGDSLTRQGRDLTQRWQTKETPAKQTSEAATLPEWDAWDRWRPEGGCLCPSGANIVWGDGLIAPLPPTITYTTEAELRELEKLRMRVALLQQEVHLEEAAFDALSPQLSSIAPGPECPDVSMLRDVYSLLGEGGQHFPALVLDSESD